MNLIAHEKEKTKTSIKKCLGNERKNCLTNNLASQAKPIRHHQRKGEIMFFYRAQCL